MKTIDVTALGELLIDFTESGLSEQGNTLLEANPGGAPCNVLAMLAKLGRSTAFIGKVGDDSFGRHLKQVVAEAGIDTRGLLLDRAVHTTLAFVHKKPDGDRDFSFYRDPGADMMLEAREVPEELIAASRIFHFGSLSMTHPGVRAATRLALDLAEKHGCLISFDPNLREPLWDSLDAAREQIAFGLSSCDVLKISDNELRWFTGEEDFDAGIAKLQGMYPIPLILLSKGRDGSSAYHRGMRIDAAPFLQKHTVETTGAGDTFCACVLNYLLDHDYRYLSAGELQEMLRFANAAASLITTRKGALRVMPAREEVEALLASRR
ncbi:MAG: carbohydrate kinase [Oscillospiraceae bacterium]|nr:carbohydrate kinase [Oscillospiraceae bacterium]